MNAKLSRSNSGHWINPLHHDTNSSSISDGTGTTSGGGSGSGSSSSGSSSSSRAFGEDILEVKNTR